MAYDVIYVDLENTIVDNFNTMVFLPEKINKLKKKLNTNLLAVNLFSYAMWCEPNRQKMIDMGQEFYEHGIVINRIVLTTDMFERCRSAYSLKAHTDVWKLSKKITFAMHADYYYKNSRLLLFDDTIDDGVQLTMSNSIEWLNA